MLYPSGPTLKHDPIPPNGYGRPGDVRWLRLRVKLERTIAISRVHQETDMSTQQINIRIDVDLAAALDRATAIRRLLE